MYKQLKYYSNVLFQNWTKKKESYSQHGEDILVENLLQNGVNSFIDIGANDGVLFFEIDLLSIDVEGNEKEVLDGLRNNQFNAKIIVLEIDKCNLSTINNLDSLQNHTAKYTNGINTIFFNINFDFPNINNLPNGFSRC